MTPNTTSASTSKQTVTLNELFAGSLLDRIGQESKAEYSEMQQAFELMGWGDLPDTLKMEIYDDVKCMVDELKGYYSSSSEFVKRRRDTVHFWVSSFQDGICSLKTAVNAVKIQAL